MKKRNIITLVILLVSLTICLFPIGRWLMPKTPKGIDLSPLRGIYFLGKVDVYDNLAKNYGDKISNKEYRENENDPYIISTRKDKSNFSSTHGITIYQFDSEKESLEKYLRYKTQFTNSSYDILYKEEITEEYSCFITYETTHFDYHRGFPFPVAVVSRPAILVAYLKNNLLIIISYHGFNDYSGYINQINEDILYAAYLLKNTAVDETGMTQQQD